MVVPLAELTLSVILDMKPVIYIYQSIDQSHFYSANIHSEARLSGAAADSVFNSKVDEAVP